MDQEPDRNSSGAARLIAASLVALALCACSPIPPGASFPRSVSQAFDRPEETSLGRLVAEAARPHGGRSGFRLVHDGAQALSLRMRMIEAAERSVDMQYFVFNDDRSGRHFLGALARAAARGVRVRLLVDDFKAPDNQSLAVLAGCPGVEVRLFNPTRYRGAMAVRVLEFLAAKTRLNARMHNKMLAVDAAAALLGGRNVGDSYFQAGGRYRFADVDVFCAGPVVGQLLLSFDEFWNHALAVPVQALGGASGRIADTAGGDGAVLPVECPSWASARSTALSVLDCATPPQAWAFAHPVTDSPAKAGLPRGRGCVETAGGLVSERMASVREELLVMSPFFVPGPRWSAVLRRMLARGTSVRVLTNSLESSIVTLAHSGYMGHRRRLVAAGADLREVRSRPGDDGQGRFSLHAKLLVFDRESLYVGSMNFDQRSLCINTEGGLIIESPELARQAALLFEELAGPESSYQVRLERSEEGVRKMVWRTLRDGLEADLPREPARGDWQRLKTWLMRLLPVDDEL